jgi:CopG family transcriptional regulator, nickel-responsive regulator
MERITISVDDDLVAEFDRFMERKGYANRSEAFRDLLRERLRADRLESGAAEHCVACLSYVYNHHERELARRLTRTQHDHHDLGHSTLHVHLDHDHCLEAVILRGPAEAVRRFAEAVIAERGVHHGRVHLIPVEVSVEAHTHAASSPAEAHLHSKPRS